jgi:hypothetical protein
MKDVMSGCGYRRIEIAEEGQRALHVREKTLKGSKAEEEDRGHDTKMRSGDHARKTNKNDAR